MICGSFQGFGWYIERMSRQAKNKKVNATLVVEKTPSYFVTEEVPARVHAMNSSAKIILVVKDPVTRLLSDYSQLAAKWRRYVLRLFIYLDLGHVSTPYLVYFGRRHANITFDQQRMIQPSFEGFVTKGGAGGAVDDTNEAVARSIYVFSMRKWMQTFNRSQIHIVNGESLVKTPWVELNKVERFVGLPQEISKANFEFVHSKGFHCLRLQQYKHHSNKKYVKCLAKTKGRRH